MCLSVQDQLLANLSLFTVLRIFRSFVNDFRTFEECVSLFSYQCSFGKLSIQRCSRSLSGCISLVLPCDSFDILSCCFCFVKNFFQVFYLSISCLSSNSDSLSCYFAFVKNFFLFFHSDFMLSCPSHDSSIRIAHSFPSVNNILRFFQKFRNSPINPTNTPT